MLADKEEISPGWDSQTVLREEKLLHKHGRMSTGRNRNNIKGKQST